MSHAQHTGQHGHGRHRLTAADAVTTATAERVRLTEPVPTSSPRGDSAGSARLLWVVALAALLVISTLGAYVLRTHNQPAAAADDVTPAATTTGVPATAVPGPGTADSEAIAARTAKRVWADLEPVGRANLCKAYRTYPHDGIKGAFLKMASSEVATFTVEGATTLQVWQHLEPRLKHC